MEVSSWDVEMHRIIVFLLDGVKMMLFMSGIVILAVMVFVIIAIIIGGIKTWLEVKKEKKVNEEKKPKD